MADFVEIIPNFDAAAAIEALLDGQATGEQPKQPEPAPAQAAAPEPEQPNSTQADAQEPSDSGEPAASDAQASAAEPTASKAAIEPAKPQAATSPDVEAMRTEAAKKLQEAESART